MGEKPSREDAVELKWMRNDEVLIVAVGRGWMDLRNRMRSLGATSCTLSQAEDDFLLRQCSLLWAMRW